MVVDICTKSLSEIRLGINFGNLFKVAKQMCSGIPEAITLKILALLLSVSQIGIPPEIQGDLMIFLHEFSRIFFQPYLEFHHEFLEMFPRSFFKKSVE